MPKAADVPAFGHGVTSPAVCKVIAILQRPKLTDRLIF